MWIKLIFAPIFNLLLPLGVIMRGLFAYFLYSIYYSEQSEQ
ncbi:MAG: hypothetical protein MRERV_1c161 [Mycoplasmataceae bacterium RV_VA103A]|nr:MAG: hypothetical protein MRERV_1c161 [Mycoplasmataceae bacterium RV_VA103A]